MFWLKKWLGAGLMPVPLALLLAWGGFLCWLAQRRRTGATLLSSALLLLTAASNQGIANRLIGPLEAQFPPLPELAEGTLPPELAACRAIVVLGGGHSDGTGAALTRLSSSAQARLTEGIRLLQALPQAKLVVLGAGRPDQPSHARVLRDAAVSLGVPRDRIQLLEKPRDTAEEMAELQALVGSTPVALVTSAWHLPRAVALARRAGLTVLPAPTDYAYRRDADGTETWWSFNLSGLDRTTKAWHERLGLWWARLRDQV